MKTSITTAFRLAPLTLALSGPPGCTDGTETGNPDIAQVSLRLTTSEPQRIAIARTQAASELTVSSARLGLSSLAFLRCNEEEEPVLTDEVVSLFDSEPLALVPGAYCAVSVSYFSALDDSPLQLDGVLPDGRPLRVRASPPSVTFLAPNPILDSESVAVAEGAQLVLVADVAQMFGEALLSDVGEEPEITVSETENTWMLGPLLTGWAVSLELHLDADGDGLVDTGSIPLMVSM